MAAPQRQGAAASSTVRTVIFWLMMIALAFVLWKMANDSGPAKPAPSAMSYSDFMANVDRDNIKSAKLLESPATAEIQGQLRDPAHDFTVTIPKEVIPDLTEKLRKQGAVLEVAAVTPTKPVRWPDMLVNLSPVLLIVGVWIYMMRLRMNKQKAPQSGNPPSGPLG